MVGTPHSNRQPAGLCRYWQSRVEMAFLVWLRSLCFGEFVFFRLCLRIVCVCVCVFVVGFSLSSDVELFRVHKAAVCHHVKFIWFVVGGKGKDASITQAPVRGLQENFHS